MLKDQYNNDHEPDEINPDPSGDSTADIYDDDTIPPAPKLQGNHSQSTELPPVAKQPGEPGGQKADAGADDSNGLSVTPHITSATTAGVSNGISFWMAGT